MDLPIEVRGRATERDHLDALRVVQRRVGSRWTLPALCLGGPALLVAMSLASGLSLRHALFANVFWLVFGPLVLVVGLPRARRQTVRALIAGNPDATAPALYRFTDRGFEERECPVEVSIGWSAVTEVLETKSALLLFVGRTKAYIVPRRALQEAGQLDRVRALLRDRLGARARLA